MNPSFIPKPATLPATPNTVKCIALAAGSAKLLLAAALASGVSGLLGGCAVAPAQWQQDASEGLRRATNGYLEGKLGKGPVQPYQADLGRSRLALSSSGQLDAMARVELAFCAAQVASLETAPCTSFERLRSDANATDLAYERYLRGQPLGADVALLPAHHQASARELVTTQFNAATAQAIADPLARLVACAAALRAGLANPQVIQTAVDTASAQGWRRPLLAWLGVQLKLARQNNDPSSAASLERRMGFISGAPEIK